ncbi:universal stress protein [Alkalilimnicola ehrlichii]|uniref:universal stress protein n=1 Tax=Alkalilimnicola ehrlichii TaxID=351052 RepID=UPI001C6EFC5E|nr:universal stress protein [Alkalilimnicola ehrlichii]
MSAYQHILLAIDLNEDCEQVLLRALDLQQRYDCQLSIFHVVEPIPVEAGSETVVPPSLYLEQEYVEQAEQKLRELTVRHGLPEQRCQVRLGHTKHEILRRAEELPADLIVVGSHGRHGLALLLGSTANAILHARRAMS